MRFIRKYLRRGEIREIKFNATDNTFEMRKHKNNFNKMTYNFLVPQNRSATISITLMFSRYDMSIYISGDVGPILLFRSKDLIEIHIDNIHKGIRDDISVWPQLTSVPSKYYYGKRAHVTAHCGYMKVHQWFDHNGAPDIHYASCEICRQRISLADTIPIERIMQLNAHVMEHDAAALMPYFEN